MIIMKKITIHTLNEVDFLFEVLDFLPDTHAWVKDNKGIFIAANRLLLERLCLGSIDKLRGKTDYDLSPRYLADQYRADDARVLMGELVCDRLELVSNAHNDAYWCLSSKWPIYDDQNSLIGTFGISRQQDKKVETTTPDKNLSFLVRYIREHYSRAILITDLACKANISVSALDRRFRKYLGKSPTQYICEVRLENASRLLVESDLQISTIAYDVGFNDHSYFTRTFVKTFGQRPSEYRQGHRSVLKNEAH
ncbi:MAG: AraC-like DNA-binding protein [Flavobacteriales bacterium]|jgi:AraC-like DNA-binding protein